MGADFAIVLRRTPEDESVKWPAQYPGQWKGTIMGSSDALGNDASHSNAVPIYMVAVQGSPFNAWLFPDPQVAARILGANVNVVTNISSINTFVTSPSSIPRETSSPRAGRHGSTASSSSTMTRSTR